MKTISLKYLLILCALFASVAGAQSVRNSRNMAMGNNDDDSHWNEATDSVQKTDIPIGVFVWNIDQRFGDIKAAEPDTLPHLFPNDAFTSGRYGHYSYTGNLGAPRVSRVLSDHYTTTFSNAFIFENPYDFFITQPRDLLFSNTKSPITNITYHECGNKQNGEDRIKAVFATNVNKRLGIGFKLDYLYGRGYYDSQSTAHFNGTLYGSYRGEAYQLHTTYYANHLKNAENGGIESDDYVTRPETFPTSYGTADMPTLLTKTWNRLNVNTFYLTHRYNLGFHRYRDEEGNIVSTKAHGGSSKLLGKLITTNDTLSAAGADSLSAKPGLAVQAEATDSTKKLIPEFVPVAGFIHTMRLDHNNRRFRSNLSQNADNSSYFNDFYLPGDSASDYTSFMHLENTLAFELREGFNKWMKTGLRLYVRHDFYKYTLPNEQRVSEKFTENSFSVGAQLLKAQGRIFHYDVLGEIRNTGKEWGEFNAYGNVDFNLPMRKDTLRIHAFGSVRGEQPSFYLRTYHARNAWWDVDYDRTFSAHIGMSLKYKRTQLSVDLATLQNYVYLQETQTPYTSADGEAMARYGVKSMQSSKNIRVLSATLRQDFKWGILNWENELTGQLTSDESIYPLPSFTGYTNLYILFRIARVLRTELGADARFFTEYKGLTYSPIIGQYVVQDPEHSTKVGNYPTVNVYANFHLKNTRFYVMASHVNYSSGSGRPFLVPHYPLNRMVLRLGISWNFFN